MSGFVDARRWLALASLVALVATGCGGKGNEKRDQVTAFVDHVNSVQQDAAPSFDRANRTYLAFSKGTLAPSAAQKRLAAAERTMRRTRDDVAAVAAPQDAAELKRRVVALFDADAALAHEATLLATFVPAQQDASKSLPGLSKRLTRDLKAGTTPAAQERALSRYAHGLDRVIGRLQPLHPPPLLLQRHHDQIVHLQTVRSLSRRLVAALRAQNSRLVARLLLRFRTLSASGSGAPVSAGAVRSYQRRYRAVQQAEQSVERERRHLEDVLG